MSTSISFADIERAKKHAKSLKSSHPHLTHAARLNRAAHELFRARDYHELSKWREATIAAHVIDGDSGATATCSFCGFLFAPDIRTDQKQHRDRHDVFEKAFAALGSLPEQHHQREDRKRAGYQLLHEGRDSEERLAGALEVLRAWFDRSLESSIENSYWKKHPSFETYVSYMVGGLTFAEDIRTKLENRFGRVDGVIKPERSYWFPPKK